MFPLIAAILITPWALLFWIAAIILTIAYTPLDKLEEWSQEVTEEGRRMKREKQMFKDAQEELKNDQDSTERKD